MSPPTPSQRQWIMVLGMAALYYAATRLGLLLAFKDSNASPVWLPSGLAVAALLLRGRPMVGSVAIGAFCANAAVFASNGASASIILGASAGITVGNCAEAVLGAWLIQKWIHKPNPFDRLSDVAKFIVIAAVVSTTSAVVGTATLFFSGVIPAGAATTVLLTWWIGDVSGILVITPLLLASIVHAKQGLSWHLTPATLVPVLALLLLGWLVFAFPAGTMLADRRSAWLFMPLIAWAAYRHGPLGVAATSLLTASVAVLGTTRGLGPFASFARENLNDALIVLQTFVVLTAITGLVLAADRMERQHLGRQSKVKRDLAVPWAVLLGGVGLTMVAWHLFASDTERQTTHRFEYIASQIQARINDAMRSNEQVLRGAAGLFAASAQVTQEEWRAYIAKVDLRKNFPGIQAVGFAQMMTREQRDAHLQRTRAIGFSDHAERPDNDSKAYSAIVYIEPFDERNQRAFGYDMLTEPVRRAAMERARDSGQSAVSGKVTLLQEDQHDTQAGTLLYHPIYQNGITVETTEQRRLHLLGFVYSPLRMGNLIRSALDGIAELEGAAVRLYSGPADLDDKQLLFDDGAASPGASGRPAFFVSRRIELPGNEWTLHVTGLPRFEATMDLQKAQIVLIAGVGLSLLLFALVRILTMTRERALMLAEDMNTAAQNSQAQFQSLAESASEAIVIADCEGHICSWNRAAELIFGYPQVEMIGQALTALMPPEYRQAHLAGFARVKAGGTAHALGRTVQLKGLRADGKIFPIELSLSSWESAAGRFYSGIIRDATARMAADAELAAKTAALERSNEDLAQYAYVASHDLKEPLRTVASYSQLLLRRYESSLDKEAKEFVQLIGEGAKHAQALVSDLLSLARLDSSGGPIQPVAMQDVLNDACRHLAAALEDSGARVTQDSLPRVMGDRAQLSQMMQNLIDNAIKFRKPESEIIIHVSAKREDTGTWRINVTDNGIGIDPRFQEKIFTIFKRLHRSDFEGTGIGLAICKKVAERHGGRIGVESEPGQGSTFFFIIAAAQAG